MTGILDVDLLAFERGSSAQRRAVVDGVSRSLATGFVSTEHDVAESLLDEAYGMLAESSCCTPEHPQRFAAISAADALDEVLYEINLVEDAKRVES